MKKIIFISVALAVILVLSACANEPEATSKEITDTEAAVTDTEAAETETEAETEIETEAETETETETETEAETETETETETEAETSAQQTGKTIEYINDPMHFGRVTAESFPEELSFLIPDNSDGFIFMMMSDNYFCIGKEVVTVDEAKWFSEQCASAGMNMQSEKTTKNDDGSYDLYSAYFDSDKYEIHIFTSDVTMDQLEVDITVK